MTKKLRSCIFVLIATLLLPLTAGCATTAPQSDIVILFTSDVHCNFDGKIGYSGLAAYKKSLSENAHVVLVDCGDAVQGNYYGAVSDGAYAIEMMNLVGYDFAAIGNHEFDYGLQQFSKLASDLQAQYLACNIEYSGSGENLLSDVKPYEIVKYGSVSVAFIGISTPESITSSAPTYFMENGELVYDFCSGENGKELYEQVQKTVDECKSKGADYVVALSHLGDSESSSPYTSTELIAATTDIDLLLDGHAHSTVPCRMAVNSLGEEVPVAEAGMGLEAIGQAVITSNGMITVGLISEYTQKDQAVSEHITQLSEKLDAQLQQVIATSEVSLTAQENGIRLVRNRETTAGNFCADAYRLFSGADIGFINGGSVRAELPKGEVTYGNLIDMLPYGNTLCVVKATGQEILDALEHASRYVLDHTEENGKFAGESGAFLQVSGLKYTIDTSIDSTVTTDENGMFVSVGDNRRVKDVRVLENGEYVALQPDKTYTVASHNYLIKDCGDGFNMFADNEFVIDEGIVDYQMLIDYITNFLNGSIHKEDAQIEGRITVI